eukprot:TRINITY_DN5121_c0_g1_i1.p1 TRINITY_DN5121_c0_g1~~TRINITY_DN5121_c0_g1_i1.p1  ORF type:complete len:624 (+),score=120.36 TRINITY_DN5121_c0_g1_i1:207-1874(+)
MVESLIRSGALWNPLCSKAFKAVDRRHFWLADTGSLAYADMPLRNGKLHISAPHIYSRALESLMPLKPGMSFLNVGSGTGYFNSIVSELTGPMATNHGVDIVQDTVEHARRRCALVDKTYIDFTVGNVYKLDVDRTSRYDRIYLGACANSRSKYLYRLLEVGGILIGPFQVGHMQQLRRVVRQTETEFNVEVLGSVQFASLVEPEPAPSPPRESPTSGQLVPPPPAPPDRLLSDFAPPPRIIAPPAPPSPPRRWSLMQATGTRELRVGSGDVSTSNGRRASVVSEEKCAGLPGVPFSFALSERPWTLERSWLYPVSFRRVVAMGMTSRPLDPGRPCIPPDLWTQHILPLCQRWWFKTIEDVSTPCQVAARNYCNAKVDLAGKDRSHDEDASTCAPSSTQTTPESLRPSVLTPEMDMPVLPLDELSPLADSDAMVEDEANSGEVGSEGSALIEVFGNGQRHTIGAAGDPDDVMIEQTHPRLAVSLRVLQLLTADTRRLRRRTWQDMEDDMEGDIQVEEDVDDATDDDDDDDGDDDAMMGDAAEEDVEMEDDDDSAL